MHNSDAQKWFHSISTQFSIHYFSSCRWWFSILQHEQHLSWQYMYLLFIYFTHGLLIMYVWMYVGFCIFCALLFLIYFLWCVRLFVAGICCGILIEGFFSRCWKAWDWDAFAFQSLCEKMGKNMLKKKWRQKYNVDNVDMEK